MKTDFLIYQNFFVKCLVVFISMIAVNLNPNFYILFAGSLLYFLPFPKYLKFWLKSTLFLLPFFISYLILGMLFKIDFYEQIQFILKIIFLVLMSVYFIKSIDIDRILTDIKFLLKFNPIKKIMIFLIALLEITPLFYNSFQIKKKEAKAGKIGFIFQIFIRTFSEVFSKLDEIELIVVKKISDFRIIQSSLKMNFYSIIMITILILSIR